MQTHLGVGQARVLVRVDVREVALLRLVRHDPACLCGRNKATHGLLGEDRALRDLLHNEGVVLLQGGSDEF